MHEEGIRRGEPSVPPSDAQGGIVVLLGPLARKRGRGIPRNEELSPKKLADVSSSIQQCGSPIG